MDQEAKNNLMHTMSSNLSILRSKLNLSQEELASLLGVTRHGVSFWPWC